MITQRSIVHVDMDAFFAAIEQRDNPALRGRPVVVGADPKGGKGRGVVSTCSYEARAFGIHSAMPISQAYRRCPHAAFLPVNMEKYEDVSAAITQIFYGITPDVEPVSIDEAFLDITGSHHLFGTPRETCLLLKETIRTKTGLTASIGLAPTKAAAKIASDLKKPDGLVVVAPDELITFLQPLPIRKIWGLGPKTEETLHRLGITTIGDLAARDKRGLVRLFGKNGLDLWDLANGIDDRPVEAAGEAKSVSNETTFATDTDDRVAIEAALMTLAERIESRLRRERIRCRTVTLKLRLEGFETHNRALTFREPTNYAADLYKAAKGLYNEFDRRGKKVRLVGIRTSHLTMAQAQADLFTGEATRKAETVHAAIDRIRGRFGDDAIFAAASRARPAASHGRLKKGERA